MAGPAETTPADPGKCAYTPPKLAAFRHIATGIALRISPGSPAQEHGFSTPNSLSPPGH